MLKLRKQEFFMCLMAIFFVGLAAGYAWRCAQFAGL